LWTERRALRTVPLRCAAPAADAQPFAATSRHDPEQSARISNPSSASDRACSLANNSSLSFPLLLVLPIPQPFPPERMTSAIALSPCMKGKVKKVKPINLRVLVALLPTGLRPRPPRRFWGRRRQEVHALPLALFHPRGVAASHGTGCYGSHLPGFIAAVSSGRCAFVTSVSLVVSTFALRVSIEARGFGARRTGRAGYQCKKIHCSSSGW
jgi:hypothetical protein